MEDIAFAPHEIRVGNGILAISPMPGRTRHYHTDWPALLVWEPDLVISLTDMAELVRKGSASLGDDLAQAGIGWLHLPIADFGVPSDWDWPPLASDLLDRLAKGQRILVHCFGGCGRSGMLVLRLMIAAGEPADAALARLRKVRPCAVETPEQMEWATQDAPPGRS